MYAKRRGLRGDDVVELFYKYQAFEKMLIQHEYLHQVDLSKSHSRRDFGKGFYTTILKTQSEEWAYRLSFRENKDNIFCL